jgi:glycosyltransferase involved in cell wall biosynthesis
MVKTAMVRRQPEVIEHMRIDLIVSPCNEDALSEAICQLATNADLHQRFGKHARLDAEIYHSWRHTAKKL